MVADLSITEAQALRKLATLADAVPESKVTGVPLAQRSEALRQLVERGLAEHVAPTGRAKKPRYRITERGIEAHSALPPPAPKRPGRPTAVSLQTRLDELQARVESLEARLGLVEADRNTERADVPREPTPAHLGYEEFRRAAHEAYRRLDQTGRTLGLVPIPELRWALGGRLPREAFDEYLLRLHQDRIINLSPPDHPGSLPADRRRDGVQHPAAGLLYFVRWVEA